MWVSVCVCAKHICIMTCAQFKLYIYIYMPERRSYCICSIYNCLDHMLGACTHCAECNRWEGVLSWRCASVCAWVQCECSVCVSVCASVWVWLCVYSCQLGNLMDCAARRFMAGFTYAIKSARTKLSTHTYTYTYAHCSGCQTACRSIGKFAVFHAKKSAKITTTETRN